LAILFPHVADRRQVVPAILQEKVRNLLTAGGAPYCAALIEPADLCRDSMTTRQRHHVVASYVIHAAT
jgi:hypothetical protein